ncbi:MAG: 3'-5' exonuclease [Myxococcales bacterium]|nr:3'-5' exonuclease [Myxococcales bacterium]
MDLLDLPLTDLPFVVVDVETTGLRPKHDRIVEVAVAEGRGARVEELLIDTLVDPGRDVGPTYVHGVTAEMVLGAPRLAELAPAIASAMHRGVVVGHNLSFDLRFLEAEAGSAGVGTFSNVPRLCTLSLARRFFRHAFDSYKLESLCARLGLVNRKAHSAAEDALVTAELLGRLLGEAAQRGMQTFGDLVRAGATQVGCDRGFGRPRFPIVRQQPRTRVAPELQQRRGSFMSKLLEVRSDGSRHDGHEQLDMYLELLDRILRRPNDRPR